MIEWMQLAEDVTVSTPDSSIIQMILFKFLPSFVVIGALLWVVKKIWDAVPKGPLLVIVLFVLAALGFLNFK